MKINGNRLQFPDNSLAGIAVCPLPIDHLSRMQRRYLLLLSPEIKKDLFNQFFSYMFNRKMAADLRLEVI